MAEDRAKKYADKYFLVDSEELCTSLKPYYDLIDASKRAVYGRFISETDMSAPALKECITTEAVMLDNIHTTGNVCIGVRKKDVINSLRPIYKEYKRSIRKNGDKPPFFHVNSLRQNDVFFVRSVSFSASSFVLEETGVRVCNDVLPAYGLRDIVRELEESHSCKLKRLTFNEVGYVETDGKAFNNVTDLELRFEFLGD